MPLGVYPHKRGPENHNWRGGRVIYRGYVYVKRWEHPRASSGGYVLEHILVAEKALGKPLPPKAVIHHVDEDGTNNVNTNLVICQNDLYHRLLHRRMRALRACGHAHWRRCLYCRQWDDPVHLQHKKSGQIIHKRCQATAERERQRFAKTPYVRQLLDML